MKYFKEEEFIREGEIVYDNGIGSNFCHVDNDMSKVQNVIWTY